MATDGPTPGPIDPEVLKSGSCIAMGYGPSNAIDGWVRDVAKQADARLDWHYAGGRVILRFLGDEAAFGRVKQHAKLIALPADCHIEL